MELVGLTRESPVQRAQKTKRWLSGRQNKDTLLKK